MSEPKHTPGPWAVEQGRGHHRYHTVITAAHAGMTAETPLAHLSNVCSDDVECVGSECVHDARLIAAAPDLLEALLAILRVREMGEMTLPEDSCVGLKEHGDCWGTLALGQARAAIMKAVGQ